MKKLSAILLLTIYSLTATGMGELLKAGVLIAHYHETRMKDNSVSFFKFLVMHYITDDGNNNDNDRDCQLPFRSHNRLVASNFSVFIINRYVHPEPALPLEAPALFCNYSNPYCGFDFSNTVWNPPRLCC